MKEVLLYAGAFIFWVSVLHILGALQGYLAYKKSLPYSMTMPRLLW